MSTCELGRDEAGHPIIVDVARLLETRLLVQANSGGGKSRTLRRLLEQTAGQVQHLVIDPEGEFATLREKYDYVICAPHDGDAVAHPRTAALLARRLLETNVSAILDVFDLKAHERQAFVKAFLDALVNAPRKLWHPVLVVLDEAHAFAPERGRAESTGAVIDAATRGRKRGLALCLATQRLAKLHKDAAAECLNKLIGRTGLDVDVKRAAEELGMTARDATAALRPLEPGRFYGFGPALSVEAVTLLAVGDVETTHPEAGNRMMTAPPEPSAKLRAVIAEGLADLPKQAEEEARTVEDLRREVAALKRERKRLEKAAKKAGIPEADVERRIRQATAEARREGVEEGRASVPAVPPGLGRDLEAALTALQSALGRLPGRPAMSVSAPSSEGAKINRAVDGSRIHPDPSGSSPSRPAPRRAGGNGSATFLDGDISAPQQRILDVLARLEASGIEAPARPTVAAHCGVSPKSGGYFNNLGRLRTAGLIDYPSGGLVALTDEGRARAAEPEALEPEAFREAWYEILPTSQRAILRELCDVWPDSLTRDELADRVGVSRTSGGYFNNLGRLRTLGAVEYPQKAAVRAEDLLFPEAGA